MRKRIPLIRPLPIADVEVAQLLLELMRGAFVVPLLAAAIDGLPSIQIVFTNYADMEWCLGALNNWVPIR